MIKILLVIWLLAHIVFAVCVIAASLMRCKKCGGWHSSREEEEVCHED